MTHSDTSLRNITTDHETIRQWVEDRGGQPAHITGRVDDDANSLYIVREDEAMEDLDPLSWEEFFETFEAEGLAFVYQDRDVGETDEWLYDLIDRAEIAERATLDSTEIEEALLEGEVVETEITETKVIERTVVETDRIQSEIVDSEIVETTIVDREPISREILGGTFTAAPEGLSVTLGRDEPDGPLGDRMEATERTDQAIETETGSGADIDTDVSGETEESNVESRAPPDEPPAEPTDEQMAEQASEPVDETTSEPALDRHDQAVADDQPTAGLAVGDEVVLDIRETVLTTTEVFDRKTVESRVVAREIAEEDTVESDAIDLQGVEETILESDIIEGEIVGTATEETVPEGAITSERAEDDVIKSQFVERRLVETESIDQYQLGCDITDHQLVDAVESRSSIVERAIVDREADEEAMLRQPEAGIRTTGEQLAAAEEEATASAEATPELGGEAGAEPDAESESESESDPMEVGTAPEPTEMGTETKSTEAVGEPPTATDDEIGKRVISGDEEVGMVADVEDGTLYVDPHPSLTDRIKAALDWGDTDKDTYPVDSDQIESITDEEVRITDV